MSAPARVSIDIWSDVMCPWCLIGWGYLSQALDTLDTEIAADIRWRAFELNPDMPPGGEERGAHLLRKYGRAPGSADGVGAQMAGMAREAGVSLTYAGDDDRPAMMWNTAKAHALLAWAGGAHGSKAQTRLQLALFAAHFQQRRPIGEPDELVAIAADEGFDREAAAAALADPGYVAAVAADRAEAAQHNVTGVLAVLIDGRFMIPGAQPAATYAAAIRRVVERRR